MHFSWRPFFKSKSSARVSGNVLFALFAAIGIVGVVGATGMNVLKGPVRGMHNVTQKTIAENNMIASSKLAIIAAASQPDNGDCDEDGTIEPLPWSTSGIGPVAAGGGYLPSSIGASLQDPWGNTYSYCVWDHGTEVQTTCPSPTLRLRGTASGGPVVALISSGPDRTFQTSCADAPDYIARVPGSDDIIMSHTYAEAIAASGGLWTLEAGDPDTAEIDKNLVVKDEGGNTTFELDKESGIGDFIGVRTGFLAAKGVEPVSMAGGLKLDTDSNVTNCTGGPHTGTLRYHDPKGLQYCDGAKWKATGGVDVVDGSDMELEGGSSGLPDCASGEMITRTGGKLVCVAASAPPGAIMAFDLTTCPTGWSEYVEARGRFIRGIDSTGTIDPSGNRTPGNQQADAFQGHHHLNKYSSVYHGYGTMGAGWQHNFASGYSDLTSNQAFITSPASDGVNGTPRIANETRPKNVAALYCRKN